MGPIGWLIGAAVFAFVILMTAAALGVDERTEFWEITDREWVNELADDSQRRHRRTRSKYCRSGVQ